MRTYLWQLLPESQTSLTTFPLRRVVSTHRKQLHEGSDLPRGMEATAAVSQQYPRNRLTSFPACAPCCARVGCCSSPCPSSAAPSSPPPAGNPALFRKLSERVREPEGLQFPMSGGGGVTGKGTPSALTPPEPVGTAATMLMVEMGLFVARRHNDSCANSRDVPPVTDCGCVLSCQQVPLWKPLCPDPFADAPCLIPRHAEGQISALLFPRAGPLLR